MITADRTNRHTEVEEVFGALSLLLNGGGIGQLRTINQELSKALSGNEPEIKAFLSNVDELVTNLDDHRGDITAALDGLNQLSTTLAGRNEQIKGALTDLTPGLQALSDQRSALVTMLQSLDTLSDVAVDTINQQPGRHGRRPRGARADPEPARRRGPEPAAGAGDPADVPVHRRGPRRDEGRLHQHLHRQRRRRTRTSRTPLPPLPIPEGGS